MSIIGLILAAFAGYMWGRQVARGLSLPMALIYSLLTSTAISIACQSLHIP